MKIKHIIHRVIALCFIGSVSASCALASDGDIDVRGTLQALNSSSVTVETTTCVVNSNTKFEDSNGMNISRSAFTIGDQVKLKCRNGIAKELELRSGSSSSSSSSESSESSSSSSQSSNGNGGDNNGKQFRDTLSPVSGVDTTASGKIRYKSEREKREIRLDGGVKIPLNTIPTAASTDEASAFTITMTISRSGVAYAECTFAFDRIVNANNAPAAQYKIDIRKQNGRTRYKDGVCDVRLSQDGIQRGIPAVKKNDTIAISETAAGVFLEGSF